VDADRAIELAMQVHLPIFCLSFSCVSPVFCLSFALLFPALACLLHVFSLSFVCLLPDFCLSFANCRCSQVRDSEESKALLASAQSFLDALPGKYGDTNGRFPKTEALWAKLQQQDGSALVLRGMQLLDRLAATDVGR
jgi:hypothetical protein